MSSVAWSWAALAYTLATIIYYKLKLLILRLVLKWPPVLWFTSNWIGIWNTNKQNSMVLVRKWTIPTEWLPLVGEASANLGDRR
jgi:hypothetical protein